MPLLIVAGQALGRPVQGATAAGAAFAVAFGAARELRGRRWAAMLSATIGMTLAALLGTLLGQDSAIFILAAAIAAAGCAALALYDEDIWWVALQVVIIFFVAGYYQGGASAATERAAMVLLGGLVQMASVVALARAFPQAAAPLFAPAARPDRERAILVAHIVRAALCVAASLVAVHRFGFANGYWAPMTALIVLKPKLRDTRVRGLARLGGTLGGCLLATVFAMACRDQPWLLLAGMTLSAGAAFALQKAHYAGLTASITATIVLLLSLGHTGTIGNAEHRILATLVGGGLAMAIALLVPHRLPGRRSETDRVGG
jgi:uncharacterized membrane protein YgaE (UPF0421/DUF939 family)